MQAQSPDLYTVRTTRTTTRPRPHPHPRPHSRNEDDDATTTTLRRQRQQRDNATTRLCCPSTIRLHATRMAPRPRPVPLYAMTTTRPPPRPCYILTHHLPPHWQDDDGTSPRPSTCDNNLIRPSSTPSPPLHDISPTLSYALPGLAPRLTSLSRCRSTTPLSCRRAVMPPCPPRHAHCIADPRPRPCLSSVPPHHPNIPSRHHSTTPPSLTHPAVTPSCCLAHPGMHTASLTLPLASPPCHLATPTSPHAVAHPSTCWSSMHSLALSSPSCCLATLTSPHTTCRPLPHRFLSRCHSPTPPSHGHTPALPLPSPQTPSCHLSYPTPQPIASAFGAPFI